MILAHLPSGYLLARGFGARRGPLLWAALAGAVAPDLDMLWFHLVDQGAIHHHRYWVHAPGFWALTGLVALPLLRWLRPVLLAPAAMFLAGVFLHLLLDTLVGGIMWGWPVSTRLFQLAEVPATQSHWVLSFLLHWSFLAEIGLILWAALLFLTARKT